nr:GAL4/SV40/VP16 fusion protein [Cloning Vector pACT]
MKLLSSIEQACPKKKRKVDEFPGISTAPPTDVSLGDELHLDGEDVAMAHADALDDFDLDMLGDGDSPGPGSPGIRRLDALISSRAAAGT